MSMIRTSRLLFAKLSLLIVPLICVLGCGSDDGLGRRAISGVVTFDGQPLADGSISFEPVEKSTTSSGAMIVAGKYSVTKEQGLPPGKYRVVVNAIKPGTGMTLPEGKFPGEEVGTPQQELIPADWNLNSKNFIEVTESGSTEFSHDIKSKKK